LLHSEKLLATLLEIPLFYKGYLKSTRSSTNSEPDGSQKPSKSRTKIQAICDLCDLTGELVRRVVASAIKKDFRSVIQIKELVGELYNEFLSFNLRNSELRKKSDSIKWNLQKIEDIVYDLKIRGMVK